MFKIIPSTFGNSCAKKKSFGLVMQLQLIDRYNINENNRKKR